MRWYHHPPSGSQHTAGGFVTDNPDRRSSEHQTICHVHHSQEYGRLIAAAPEMLEVLVAVIGGSKGVAECEEVEVARRLIAYIRGKRRETI